ncbi:MAG: PLP-dependent aminotransferase family protein [Proteobacteria bacterium]|nr:PLP-dependent aminotransferase family protein [Pseudomonadota bacterium]
MNKGPDRRPWRFDLLLGDADSDGAVPRYERLARAIIRDIRRGRLVSGALLPGTRTLARALGVNRKVVVAAFEELVAQGWLETMPAQGTRVSARLPELAVADADPKRGQAVTARHRTKPRLHLSDGIPDARLAPLTELGRAYRRALRSLSRSGLGYQDPSGDLVLRGVLAAFLNQARGLACSPDQVLITHGSQMALSLTALTLCKPGDHVAVENPGYVPAWNAFTLAGARLIHVAVDTHGLDTAALRHELTQCGARVRLVYVTPHHQYPTTVALAPHRRIELLALAKEHDFLVIEDDYDHEYHFDRGPLLPLAASGSGLEQVVYVGSLSKLIAPALRIGYIVAHREVIEQARARRAVLDRQGDIVLERAVAELIEDGELQRHARKARRMYHARRDFMGAALEGDDRLRGRINVDIPAGGLALWVRVCHGVSVENWARAARLRGLGFTPGSAHAAQGDIQAFRAGFAALDDTELAEAVRILGDSLLESG